MKQALALVPLVAFGAVAAVAVAGADDPPTETQPAVTETVVQVVTVERKLRGRGVAYWHARARASYREAKRLGRVLRHEPAVVEAINLACAVYGHCADLWRKARCETGGTFAPRSYNRHSGASGLLQFLPSTWKTTPYRRFSVWSPYANALAAGWMHEHGRGGEWSCP